MRYALLALLVLGGCAPEPAAVRVLRSVVDFAVKERPPPRLKYWTAAAQMKSPPHAVPAGVANVVAHVPEGLDPRAPLNVVLFLHGSEQCAAQLAYGGDVVCKPGQKFIGASLNARHDDAGLMTIFVIPQRAYMAGGGPGRFTEAGYLRTFLAEVLGETMAPGLGGPRTLDDVASITIVSQSAGWIATAAMLDHRDLEDKVKNVVLIDSFFDGGVGSYVRWLERDPSRRFVSVHASWGSNVGNARALAARMQSSRRVVVDPPGALADAVRAHDVTVSRRDYEHSWMPLLLLTKAIEGLPLPRRAVVPARTVWPGAEVRPARPLSVPGDASGAITRAGTLLATGGFADDYEVTLEAGRSTTIEVRGGDSYTEWGKLDVLVQVLSNDRELARDDDGAGAFDARLVFTPPASGKYVVRVGTHGQGPKHGPYTLRIR